MQFGQRAGNLSRVFDSFLRRDTPRNSLFQIAARYILHCDMCMVITHTEVINPDDIRVIKLRDHLVFLQKTIEHAQPTRDVRHLPQDFQDDVDVV